MMQSSDVHEAATIAREAADLLLATSNDQRIGRAGSDLRRACGDLKANAEVYVAHNKIAAKLAACFEQARVTGATMDEFDRIRASMAATVAVSLVAVMIKQASVCYSLQQFSIVLAATTFTSRQDVENLRPQINDAFNAAEEIAADEMSLVVYRTLVALHAAVSFYLYETARPLPQMLDFQFTSTRPTLILSQRLYAVADRADELREENKVVHPAFAPRSGRALAF